ncbi:MAG: HEAT repeat domain-containing protein [Planctomycetota bacterium]
MLSILPLLLAAPQHGLGQTPAGGDEVYTPRVAEASSEGADAMARFKVPKGFALGLFAAEPHLANPVCLAFDPQGRVYVAETFRHHKGVTDMREHMAWLEDDIAALTVADRVAMFLKREGPERFKELYCVEHERVRRIVDTDGDGVADLSTVFADGFDDPAAGIGAGLLVRPLKGGGQDVWYTCIPDLWRLTDADDDGVAEARERHTTGYGVRVALLGHDMHGLAIGPDGRLYFSIGDRGFHVETREGRTLSRPGTGAVFRCELDGADLELYCVGLRNPQELVFDDHGDLFTGDNNSDGGDQARWTWLLEGSDTGWRQAYQWCNDVHTRGPWNEEALWKPFHAEQPAYVLPPIANFTSGPSGLTVYPGTGWSPEWNGTFFLCDFRGAPGYSGVHAFRNAPKGAGFALSEAREFLWNCLPTDVDFGYDGNLYTVDWVDGWNQTGKGRVYRLAPEERSTEEAARVAEVQRLLGGELRGLSHTELVALFQHPDRRVRQEAQLALAERALDTPDSVAAQNVMFDALTLLREPGQDVQARIHSAWLVGHVGRRNPEYGQIFGPHLMALLEDVEPELRAQGARVIGELGYKGAAEWIELLLEDAAPRVRLFAAEAAGRLGGAVNPRAVLALLAREGATDPWIRQTCVRALERLRDVDLVHSELARSDGGRPAPAVRRALAVVLRRWHDPRVAALLDDSDPAVVAEAADAIHGARIEEAFPALAELLARPAGQREYTVRRALDANRLVGGAGAAARVARFVVTAGEPAHAGLRAEALDVLTRWSDPRTRDLVIQDRWPLEGRPAAELEGVVDLLRTEVATLRLPNEVMAAWVRFASRHDQSDQAVDVLGFLARGADAPSADADAVRFVDPLEVARSADVRRAALEELYRANPRRAASLARGFRAERDGRIRASMLTILGATEPEVAVANLMEAIAAGTRAGEAVTALGAIGHPAAEAALVALFDGAGGAEPAWMVEWLEVAGARPPGALRTRVDAHNLNVATALQSGDPLAGWRMTLSGGDAKAGRKVFREHPAVTCTKCHKLGGEGGSEAGPVLDGVATRLTPEELLRSVVDPNAALAEGFQNWLLRTTDDEVFVGRLIEDTPERVVLETNQLERYELAPDEIALRKRDVSAMPQDTASHLSRREMRDLMAFLQGQRTPAPSK